MSVWQEVGDGVFVGRYAEWDLSVGLVVGRRRCLVVDTRADESQGAELAAAVRAVTPLPWTVVLTHHHFDHSRGLPAFLPCAAWAHPRCAARMRRLWPKAPAPAHAVRDDTAVDLGGRTVWLRPAAPAHTDNDVVAHVPDAGVLFAGDLVEHVPGGTFSDESFEETDGLRHWPAALDAVLAHTPTVVVPGHGEPVDAAFVATAREQLSVLAGLRADRDAGTLTTEQALARSPLARHVTRAALR